MRRMRAPLEREVHAGSRVVARRVLASVVVVVGVAVWCASPASAASPVVVQTFSPFPNGHKHPQVFEIPNVSSLQLTLRGGSGGPGYAGGSTGGAGGRGTQVTGTMAVGTGRPATPNPGHWLYLGVAPSGTVGMKPDPDGRCVVGIGVSLGGFGGSNGFAEAGKSGGNGGWGSFCLGGGGGGGGASTVMTYDSVGGPLWMDVGGGGGGGGGGGIAGYGGGSGGSGGFPPMGGAGPGGAGSGTGAGAGGGGGANPNPNRRAWGEDGAKAAECCSGGGGGGGGAGWDRGGAGGSGASGAGGGGGGGAGTTLVNHTIIKNAVFSFGPSGAQGVVMISYTAPSASALTRLQCAGRPATMVVKGPALVKGTPGRDVIVGDRGANQIDGTRGDDTICGGDDVGNGVSDRIAGGRGNDRLYGGPRNDRIFSRDGQRDVIDCGPGHDEAIVDAVDRTRRCETVIRPHPPRRRPAPPTGLG